MIAVLSEEEEKQRRARAASQAPHRVDPELATLLVLLAITVAMLCCALRACTTAHLAAQATSTSRAQGGSRPSDVEDDDDDDDSCSIVSGLSELSEAWSEGEGDGSGAAEAERRARRLARQRRRRRHARLASALEGRVDMGLGPVDARDSRAEPQPSQTLSLASLAAHLEAVDDEPDEDDDALAEARAANSSGRAMIDRTHQAAAQPEAPSLLGFVRYLWRRYVSTLRFVESSRQANYRRAEG